jgi:hypothetical protein
MNEATSDTAVTQEVNIDLHCICVAEKTFNAIKEKNIDNPEKSINEALAILKENGLYALIIYLESQKDAGAYQLLLQCIENIGSNMIPWTGDSLRKKAGSIASTDNIFDLFFAIDIIEQTLIYTRYLVKGLPKKQQKPQSADAPAVAGNSQS